MYIGIYVVISVSMLVLSLSLLNTDWYISYSNTCTYKRMTMQTAFLPAAAGKVRIYRTIHYLNANKTDWENAYCHSKEKKTGVSYKNTSI